MDMWASGSRKEKVETSFLGTGYTFPRCIPSLGFSSLPLRMECRAKFYGLGRDGGRYVPEVDVYIFF